MIRKVIRSFKWIYQGLKVLNHDLERNDMFKQASAMAYITLFSLIPSLAAVFTLISVFRPFLGENSDFMVQIKGFILDNLAAGSGTHVVKYLDTFLANLDLKKIGISSFAGLLITLLLLLRQIEEALNRIWMVPKGRNFFKRFFYFWAFLTLGAFILSIVVGVTSDFDFSNLLSFDSSSLKKSSNGFFSSMGTLIGEFAFFFLLYKMVPNTSISFKEAAIGALLGSFLFHQASRFYGLYIKSFTNYQSLYGALAALPLFLFWLYICWLIILIGAIVAWRVREGFHFEDKKDFLDDLLKPENHLSSTHLRTLLPFFIALEVYRKFTEGAGAGRSCKELATALKVPIEWVFENVDSLKKLGLVIACKNRTEKDNDIDDPFGEQLFPAFPPNSVKLSQLFTVITDPTIQWMTSWHNELPIDFQKALSLVGQSVGHVERKKILEETMDEFLGRITIAQTISETK